MTDNLVLWNALSKTDPKHTKSFNRAGGFRGTAIKPIWIVRKLTEAFGPAGTGWGINEPSFQVVPADGEILVYCTVSAWHGSRDNVLYGVGGDKVQVKRQGGSFCDDEAFKKAFTDAVNNAFKFIGVGADIHMGMFEDDKYVTATKAEFAEAEKAAIPGMTEEQFAELTTLIGQTGTDAKAMCEHYKVGSLRELTAAQCKDATERLYARLPKKKEAA